MIAAHRRAPSESWRPLTSALEGYPWAVDCLNEIVSVFLIIIPVAETSLSRDWTWRTKRWIAAQALAAPIAFLALEIIVSGYVIAPVAHAESGSHLRMLLFYAGLSDHSMASLHNFSLNWLFFNIAAPAQDALYSIPIWPHYRGYFEPSLVNYLFRPVTVALIVMFALIVMSMDSFESVPTFGVILVICWLRLRLIHWCGGLYPPPPRKRCFSALR